MLQHSVRPSNILLSMQRHSSLSFLKFITETKRQNCSKPSRRSLALAGLGRNKIPRPDAALVEERRSERAVGGSMHPSAPRGSLFALELKAQRHSPEELRVVDNRFPFKEGFELGDGRHIDSDAVLDHLESVIEAERLSKIKQVVAGRTFSVVPVLEGIYDRGNIGAVARSADALGFGSLHYIKTLDPRRLKGSMGGKRTSGGSQKWLDMQVWDSSAACFQHLKAAGYFIAATHLAPDSIPISDLDFTKPTVIIMGNESFGVSHEALEYADQAVIIPQAPGFVDSFNVSVATALALYEARTSRIRAMGSHGDLTDKQQRILTAAMLLRHKGSPWGRAFMDGRGENPQIQMEVGT